MDDATRKAWAEGPYGRCLALAQQDREQKRAERLHWSAANFIDDETPDAQRVRPTETAAVTRAFWRCDDAHAVARSIRDGVIEERPYAHFPHVKDSTRVMLESDWLAILEHARLTEAENRRVALEKQMKAWRTVKRRAVPLFDLSEIA